MSARILDGKAIAARIRSEVAERAERFAKESGRPPGLAVVLVGEDPASQVYVRNKARSAEECGLRSELVRMPEDASEKLVLAEVERLGADPGIDGLLVQLPLPSQVDPERAQRAVPPEKDVDGLHPDNAGKLLLGARDALVPCTPLGVMALLEEAGARLEGSRAVVVGRSSIVGKPAALLLLARHATVTLCHSRTKDLAGLCREADVLVAAVGRAGLVRGDWIKPGAIVIDVGTNRITDEELASDLLSGQEKRLARFRKKGEALVGDVHFAECAERASAITPVPGGVGPLTVAMLLANTLRAAELRRGRAA